MNTLRVGKISSINADAGTARVTYEDLEDATTVELPFLAWEWSPPAVGEKVLTGQLSNATTDAVIIGPIWTDGKTPGAGSSIFRKVWGAAAFEYDSATDSLIIEAGGCSIVIEDGRVDITGDLTVSGSINGG